MNNVIHDVADEFKERIEKNAKTVNAVYSDSIELRQVDENSFAVLVSEQKERLSNLGSALVYYQPLSPLSKGLGAILQRFGPYPASLLPYRHGSTEFRLVYKRVSPKEYDLINQTLYAEGFRKVRQALMSAKVPMSKILSENEMLNSDWAEAMAWEDLAFNTIREELGMRTKKKPVWLPAIGEFRSGDLMPDASEPDKIQTEQVVSKDLVSSLDRFQRAVLK